MQLGFEAQCVIGLRMVKMALGGDDARSETQRMIAEKSKALWDANNLITRSLLSGHGHLAPARTLALYRRRVRANQRRLSGRG